MAVLYRLIDSFSFFKKRKIAGKIFCLMNSGFQTKFVGTYQLCCDFFFCFSGTENLFYRPSTLLHLIKSLFSLFCHSEGLNICFEYRCFYKLNSRKMIVIHTFTTLKATIHSLETLLHRQDMQMWMRVCSQVKRKIGTTT